MGVVEFVSHWLNISAVFFFKSIQTHTSFYLNLMQISFKCQFRVRRYNLIFYNIYFHHAKILIFLLTFMILVIISLIYLNKCLSTPLIWCFVRYLVGLYVESRVYRAKVARYLTKLHHLLTALGVFMQNSSRIFNSQ